MHEIYEETFKVCTWDVDRADKLTMAATYNYCQEVAGIHAGELGVGTEYMRENGIVWVLSRMSAVLERRPAWREKVIVRTWPRGTDRLFAIRDYELIDSKGIFCRGRSAWLIVDLSNMRPRRPEAFTEGLPRNEGRNALVDEMKGLEVQEGLHSLGSRVAGYSDIDYNGHTNNARYVQWIQDVSDVDALSSANALRLDLNYLAEVRPGVEVELFGNGPKAPSASTDISGAAIYDYEGRLKASQTPSFRARLTLS